MSNSKIEWTESTWNPTTGCNKISAGCKYCYAEVLSRRLKAMGNNKYKDGFRLTEHPEVLNDPFKWRKGRMVFVNSMSDLFHPDVGNDFIYKIFDVMNNTPQHTYQILTKRSARAAELSHNLNWSDNIWMGVSVENRDACHRIDDLRMIDARVRFLSCEPLIGPLEYLNLAGIHWVIVGGESGSSPRPIEANWIVDILQQCLQADVKFFFKQWGGKNKKATGRSFLGKTWDNFPIESHRS